MEFLSEALFPAVELILVPRVPSIEDVGAARAAIDEVRVVRGVATDKIVVVEVGLAASIVETGNGATVSNAGGMIGFSTTGGIISGSTTSGSGIGASVSTVGGIDEVIVGRGSRRNGGASCGFSPAPGGKKVDIGDCLEKRKALTCLSNL
jgi:hypothetical protein